MIGTKITCLPNTARHRLSSVAPVRIIQHDCWPPEVPRVGRNAKSVSLYCKRWSSDLPASLVARDDASLPFSPPVPAMGVTAAEAAAATAAATAVASTGMITAALGNEGRRGGVALRRLYTYSRVALNYCSVLQLIARQLPFKHDDAIGGHVSAPSAAAAGHTSQGLCDSIAGDHQLHAA